MILLRLFSFHFSIYISNFRSFFAFCCLLILIERNLSHERKATGAKISQQSPKISILSNLSPILANLVLMSNTVQPAQPYPDSLNGLVENIFTPNINKCWFILKVNLWYSAANFCFNKGLCMIWSKGTLSKAKSCHDLGFQSDMDQIFQIRYCMSL